MKRLAALAFVLAFSMPSISIAASDYVSSFEPGTYKGHVVSVHPDINDTEATMEIARSGNDLVAKVKYADSVEEWVWNSKSLTQTEYDLNERPLRKYTATAKTPASGSAQRFDVDCRAKGSCTEEIDPRHSWRLEADGAGVTYSVYGVSMDDWGKEDAKAHERHVLRFTRVDTGMVQEAKH